MKPDAVVVLKGVEHGFIQDPWRLANVHAAFRDNKQNKTHCIIGHLYCTTAFIEQQFRMYKEKFFDVRFIHRLKFGKTRWKRPLPPPQPPKLNNDDISPDNNGSNSDLYSTF